MKKTRPLGGMVKFALYWALIVLAIRGAVLAQTQGGTFGHNPNNGNSDVRGKKGL